MASGAELTKEEEELFNQMAKGEEAPKDNKAAEAAAEAAKKAEADKAAKEAADKAAAAEKAKEKDRGDLGGALKEARAENKELRKELDALKTTLAQGNDKLQKFMESVSRRAEEDKTPKFEDDPAANLKAENDSLKKQISQINDKLAKQDAATEGQSKMTAHASAVQAAERAFAKAEPTYFKASDYVAEVWRDEFREAGFPEEEIPKLVFGKALAVTHQATSAGRDPAQAIWNIAKRYGFKPEAPKSEAKGEAKDGESKLQQIKDGLEASKDAGGGSGPEDLTLASLASMDDDAIDKLVADKDWWSKTIRGRSALH